MADPASQPPTSAMVTGATSGIGLAFAQHLARRGYDIVLVARDEARLHQTADTITAETGRRTTILRADLAQAADVQRVADRLAAVDEPIGILVNNAGMAVRQRLTDPDPDPFDTALDVMCRAVLVLGGAAARAMLPRGRGAIINVSSTAGYMTMGMYSAIKAWVTVYTESLAVELRGTGVQATALCPGWVHTEFHQRAGISTSSIPSWLWTDTDDVVTTCLRDVARGKVVSIPSARYRALMWAVRHLPRGAVRSVSGRITSRRGTPDPGDEEVR
ncbi:SDR family NAD(P)-dependent oxidoreductase [Phytoactinopolyspora limicola]|uniref:SDR family NAD(P)-dependent oxidoreductase n=1 Tax=Phytoactinopolyspora limicola TaxID=2715536 RepID=UPI001A9C5467|nr:SDR family NAD(P)-dependent oxidoreductase [Phytoactinopolyspora limicola]